MLSYGSSSRGPMGARGSLGAKARARKAPPKTAPKPAPKPAPKSSSSTMQKAY